jgi:putative hemolysin
MVQDKKTNVDQQSVLGQEGASHFKFLNPIIERITGLNKIKSLYRNNLEDCDEVEFLEKSMELLDVKFNLDEEQLKNIPTTGPVILAANHPYGGHDALLLNAILQKVRPDYKIMANEFFAPIKALENRLILVDAFHANNSKNSYPLRETVKLLKSGGALGLFPAGSVSHLELHNRHITDSEWSDTLAGLVELTGATVVPVYFSGRNSLLFNFAGLVNNKIRTALLPRELIKHKKCIDIQIGKPISGKYLSSFQDRRKMADYLKMRCYLLGENDGRASKSEEALRIPSKVVDALPAEYLTREIASLPADCKILDYKEYSVFCSRSPMIPSILHEIGRLREITFREVEEGTGFDIDLDDYDDTYLHLFIWNREKKEVVGAYRMGEVDQLGKEGLYTAGFYHYSEEFLSDHKNALEMGRSFIRKEYQRKPFSLLLLWRGICQYVAKNPQYKYLFGAVSMSDEYDPRSRGLTAKLLLERQKSLKSKLPVKIKLSSEIRHFCDKYSLDRYEDLSELIRGIEEDGRDLPVLIKQYMKLGGRFYSFCVDQDFGNTLDGLIVVDLTKAPLRSLKQYMGDKTETYLDCHR